MISRYLLPACVLLLSLCLGTPCMAAEPSSQRVRPTAIVSVPEYSALVVASEGTGELIAIDVAEKKIVGRQQIGTQLSDLAWSTSLHAFLAIDHQKHLLLQIAPTSDRQLFPLKVTGSYPVPPYPIKLALDAGGKSLAISSLWSHQLTIAQWSSPNQTPKLHSLELPFPPRELAWSPLSPSQVVVASAFRAQLAQIDFSSNQLLAVTPLKGHNIRGLLWSPTKQEWFLTQQHLDEHIPITKFAIARGAVMSNLLVQVPPAFTSSTPQTVTHPLDTPTNGAADPAGITLLPKNRLAIALSGTNEVALISHIGSVLNRISVGAHPTRLQYLPSDTGDSAKDLLAVVCHLEDKIDLISLEKEEVVASIPLSSPRELANQELGEQLFYNASLSHDHWYSCHSCHSEGHTNGLKADTQGDGNFGAPKRTLSLMGTRLTDRWAWNASMQNLRDQVLKSLDTTMHADHYTQAQSGYLVDYLHSLPPAPPLHPASQATPRQTAAIARGEKIFTQRGCIRCHVPPLTYTSHDPVEVGISDELGNKKFSPPSLRGVSQGDHYLHDNRATSLRALFEDHAHQLSSPLEGADLEDLLHFLESL